MNSKKVVAFDLDDTLSLSKMPVEDFMVDQLCRLLEEKYVAVISGANFEQFNKQFISRISCKDLFNKLFILPVKGSQMFKFEEGSWVEKYSYEMRPSEREHIKGTIYEVLRSYGFDFNQKIYGELITDKSAGITLSLQGSDAPLEVKEVYDPDHKKRQELLKLLKPLLPEYSISIGGKTSIDVTPFGIDKAFGLTKLSEMIHIPLSQFVFIGDALFPGGNDSSVKRLDIDTIAVDGTDGTVRDTAEVIENIIQGKVELSNS